MLDQPISPELALVDGWPAGRRPAEVEAVIDPLDIRRAPVTAGPSGMGDASSRSVEAMLFQAGLITADQLGELVRDSVVLNRPAAEVALERGLVSQEVLEAVLAKTFAPSRDALPFPLPVEIMPLNPVIRAETPLEPIVPAVIAEQSPQVVLLPAEPATVAELHALAEPAIPLEPASPLSSEALQALLAAAPAADVVRGEVQTVYDVPPVETLPLQPEAPVEPAMPSVAPQQSQPVVLLPAEPELAVAEPLEPVMRPTPPTVADLPAEATPTSVATVFAVLLRLQTGERINVDKAASFETAAHVARRLADRLAGATEWPLLAGRCIRPDAVVSVDIERTLEA